MKIFSRGKMISPIGSTKTLKGKTAKEITGPRRRLIAQYKFDKSIYENLIPEFNTEFTNYEIVDEYLDTEDIVTTSTETIMIMNYDAEPDEYGILTTEYEIEHVSTFSAENIVTRSIYSTDLPTLIRFGTGSGETPKTLCVLEVLYLNTSNVTTMNSMFQYCKSLTSIDVSNFDTSKVTNMTDMFYACKSLTSLDLSNFNTSNVTTMNAMFYNCRSLISLNVSNFDTSKITNMEAMFLHCLILTKIEGVSNFDTSNVNNMRNMFYNCNKLTSLDLSNFDTSKVTNMESMFRSCKSLTQLDVSNFDTSKVTNMRYMFQECSNLVSIDMKNSDYNSVNKIIAQLPTRTTDSIGTLDIDRIDNIGQVDIDTLNNKYWIIASHTILNHARLDQTKIGN